MFVAIVADVLELEHLAQTSDPLISFGKSNVELPSYRYLFCFHNHQNFIFYRLITHRHLFSVTLTSIIGHYVHEFCILMLVLSFNFGKNIYEMMIIVSRV